MILTKTSAIGDKARRSMAAGAGAEFAAQNAGMALPGGRSQMIVYHGQLPPRLEKQIFAMKTGEVSPVGPVQRLDRYGAGRPGASPRSRRAIQVVEAGEPRDERGVEAGVWMDEAIQDSEAAVLNGLFRRSAEAAAAKEAEQGQTAGGQ